MDLIVRASGRAVWNGRRMRCAVGRGGVDAAKREGDGKTPAGRFALRGVLYRADRLAPPPTRLARAPIGRRDGWCAAPGDPFYNRRVRLPHPSEAETLWRADGCYDLLAVIGYNDAPAVAGLGSAIFLHVARPGWTPTAGCVALALDDLRRVLASWRPGDRIAIEALGSGVTHAARRPPCRA